ncbi:hypothetical protein [Pseudoalteromonas sp. SA25]|uniref:hypothetical protein n=1 Tax=Pseudoalteromonas sp. SA25 TaxID=2686347 RepID=UPI0013FE213C|nr:hypothetical protein [Pseudoalteromonas sp. SA25]
MINKDTVEIDQALDVDWTIKEKSINYIEQILKGFSHNNYAVERYQDKLHKQMKDAEDLIRFVESNYNNVQYNKISISPH